MAKKIEQEFSHRIASNDWLHVTARNNKAGHIININGGKDLYISVEELKELGEFIIKTAEEIKADTDFKPQP